MEIAQNLVEIPGLPLAVYRELAAHLRQVEGVSVDLIPQKSQQFDYYQSQIGGLAIEFAPNSKSESRQRVEQILAYYQTCYHNCHREKL